MTRYGPPAGILTEISVCDLRTGDRVHFLSDKGGWRTGTVVTVTPNTVTVRADGRARAERVPKKRADKAWRDTWKQEEEIKS